MKRNFFVFSIILSLCLQNRLFAAPLPEYQQAIDAVDRIRSAEGDPAAVSRAVKPVMESAAESLEKKPDDFRMRFVLARAYERLGMETMAADEDKIAESAGKPFQDFVLFALKEKVLLSDFEPAMTYFHFARKYFPTDPSVAIVRAIELNKKGQLQEEETLLEKIVASDPKDTGIYSVLAALKADTGRYQEAVRLFNRDLARAPAYFPARIGKAIVLNKMGHHAASLYLSIPLYIQNPYKKNVAALVSSSFCQSGEYKKALRPCAVALGVAVLQPEMDEAKRRLKVIWPRLPSQVRQEEIAGVSQVVDKTVWGSRMHFAIGDALLQAGYAREAEQQFKAGLKIQPRHGRAYLHLGEIYQNYYHNKPTAFLYYLKYLVFSDDPLAKAKLQRLSSEFNRKNDIALRIKNYVNRSPQ